MAISRLRERLKKSGFTLVGSKTNRKTGVISLSIRSRISVMRSDRFLISGAVRDSGYLDWTVKFKGIRKAINPDAVRINRMREESSFRQSITPLDTKFNIFMVDVIPPKRLRREGSRSRGKRINRLLGIS